MSLHKVPEVVPLNGHIKITVFEKDENGVEHKTEERMIKNLIVNVGKDSILKYIGNLAGGGYANGIGVGDSATAASATDTDLLASTNKLWQVVNAADKVYVRPTLFASSDFGYAVANFTWNELGIRDNQGSPLLWARQVDGTPLVKTSSKRAIVEWQLSL